MASYNPNAGRDVRWFYDDAGQPALYPDEEEWHGYALDHLEDDGPEWWEESE